MNAVEEMEPAENKQVDVVTDFAPSEPGKKEDYSIINYMLKKPTLLIGAISGFVAFLSFGFNCVSYFQDFFYAQYWNVNTSHIKIVGDSTFYSVIFAFILLVISFILFGIWNHFFQKFEPHYNWFRIYQKIHKKAQITLKKEEKEKRRKGQNKESLYPETKTSDELSSNHNALIMVIRKRVKSYFHFITLFVLFASVTNLTILISAFLMISTQRIIYQRYYIVAVAWAFAYSFIPFFGYYIGVRKRFLQNKEELKKKFKKEWDEMLDGKQVNFEPEEDYHIQFKKLFSNNKLILMFSFTLFLLISLLFSTVCGPLDYQNQKSFETLQIDNKQYVSVYSNSEIMVLEEVEINNGEAKIFLNKQRIINVTDYPYEIVTFKSVSQIKDQ